MNRRLTVLVLLMLVLGAGLPLACTGLFGGKGAAPAEQAATAVEKAAAGTELTERLPNGLRVIVRERHLGGVAAFRIYISAGSLNEGRYTGAGVSHLLEHVVAGGATPTRTEDQIRDALEAIGAQTNAMTSKQWVTYFGEVAGTQIDPLIEIIGDFVSNNLIEEKAFAREFQVVQRELERSLADPDHHLWDLADENFFLDHPARIPVSDSVRPCLLHGSDLPRNQPTARPQ